MANNAFGSEEAGVAGAFSVRNATVVINPLDSSGLIIGQVGFQYSQQIAEIYSLTTPDTYFLFGRTQGRASLQNTVGPQSASTDLFQQLGQGCNISNNNMDLLVDIGCESGSAGVQGFGRGVFAFTMKGVVLESMAGQMSSANNQFQIPLNTRFVDLLVEEGGAAA